MIRFLKKAGTVLGTCFFLLCFLILPAKADSPCVALTFDDGPSGPNTEKILKALSDADVKATFFVCGYRMEQFPQSLLAIKRAGHELGVHGYAHKYMNKMTQNELFLDIRETAAMIAEYTGQAPTLLRPPGGLLSDRVTRQAQALSMPIVLWQVDPEDWKKGATSTAIAKKVVSQAEDGDIILLHDLHQATSDALPTILSGLKERGFTICTVSELAARKGVCLNGGACYNTIS